MPNASCMTLTTGARQFVVQEALEMTWCFAGSYVSSLTPRTNVRSSPFAGARDDHFLRAAAVDVRAGLVGVGEDSRLTR